MIKRDTYQYISLYAASLTLLIKISETAVEGSEENILICKFSHAVTVLSLYVFVVV